MDLNGSTACDQHCSNGITMCVQNQWAFLKVEILNGFKWCISRRVNGRNTNMGAKGSSSITNCSFKAIFSLKDCTFTVQTISLKAHNVCFCNSVILSNWSKERSCVPLTVTLLNATRCNKSKMSLPLVDLGKEHKEPLF